MKLLFLAVLAGALGAARGETSTDSAARLYAGHHYAEARTALEKITAAEPQNAAACYYLGLSLLHRGDDRALDDAVVWLERAAKLAPANAAYLADYGGTCLEVASRRRSFLFATRGRDAMERSLTLNPDNLNARNGLMLFYAQAPWPLGSAGEASAQAAEILKRDPARGLRAYLALGRSFEKKRDRTAAAAAYGEVLRLAPGHPEATAALERMKKP